MSGDCLYFQSIIKELNPEDKNSGDCCSWDMVSCDKDGYIEKLDFSKYKITLKGPFPQSVAFFSHLKEFSIHGQKGINEIYQLNTDSLEKIDLSDSGMSSPNFPSWLYDAPKVKELDISGTQITGVPQREFKSQFKQCNFANTPICGSYETSPYNFIPDACKTSCTKGGSVSNNSSGSSSGGTKIWPFILIGVIALLLVGLGAFLYLKKVKKDNEFDYDEYTPKPEPKKDNKIKREDSIEITVNENIPFTPSSPAANVPAAATATATAAVNKQNDSIANNNNGNVSIDHEQSYQPHPSIYNTMINDADSDEEVNKSNNAVNVPIVQTPDVNNNGNQNQVPELLRRKSSKKNPVNSKGNTIVEASTQPLPQPQPQESVVPQQQEELYIANWDYQPTLSDELALTAGDVIEIRKKFDDGWCSGYNRRTNQTGIVPLCYLMKYNE